MEHHHTAHARTHPAQAITAESTCPGHRHWVVTGAAVGLLFAYLAGVLSGVFHADVTTADRLRSTTQGTPMLLLVVVLAAGMAAVVQFVPALRAGIVGVLGLLLVTGLSLSAVAGGPGTERTASAWGPSALLEGTGYNPIGVALVGSALAHAVVVLIAQRKRAGSRRASAAHG